MLVSARRVYVLKLRHPILKLGKKTPMLISWIFVCTIESKDYHRLLTKKSVI